MSQSFISKIHDYLKKCPATVVSIHLKNTNSRMALSLKKETVFPVITKDNWTEVLQETYGLGSYGEELCRFTLPMLMTFASNLPRVHMDLEALPVQGAILKLKYS